MKYSCKVPCEKDKLKDIRQFINDTLHNHGLSDLDISTLVLAIDEVCANLIIHSHRNNPQDQLEVIVIIEANKGITFKIIDRGDGFDINEYKEPSIDELILKKRKGGVGLILVKKIMDDIEFQKINDTNCCKLFKKIPVK